MNWIKGLISCAVLGLILGATTLPGLVAQSPDTVRLSSGSTNLPTPYSIFLPVTMRSRARLSNGDFESGDLRGWGHLAGSFGAYGTGVPATVVEYAGSYRGQLGSPVFQDGAIPVGYAAISQSFTVEYRYFSFQYYLKSYDSYRGIEYPNRYVDTFEVSVDRIPEEITREERQDLCVDAKLNPDNVTIPVHEPGMVFCGGARRAGPKDLGAEWTSGWRLVELDLEALRGQTITLYLTMWSREYDDPYRNDEAWYNTWVYLDNFQFSRYFEGPWEVEPNNTWEQANGPLISGRNYYGYPNDARDYFSICIRQVGYIRLNLTDYTGQGVQVQLYHGVPRVDQSNLVTVLFEQPYELLILHPPSGWYYLMIYTESGHNQHTPYTLRVTYPE